MDNDNAVYIASICAVVFLSALGMLIRQRGSNQPPYPPGPRRYPLIGSALGVPRGVPIWQAFISISRKYNTDILHINLFSTDYIVLNSSEAISDLLDKRSAIYSDRPIIPMFELMDIYSWNIGFLGYGNKWRRRRRLFHQFFNMNAVTNFDDYQRFLGHAKFVTGALIMDITYDLDIKSHEDKFLQAAERAMEWGEGAVLPGAFLVNTFPILKHIPEYFPGAGFKKYAEKAQGIFDAAVNRPLEHVKESLKANGSNLSVASSCFDRMAELQNQGFDESDIRAVTSTTYLAAADTTLTTLESFFLVMVLYPHVMKKAHEELDKVVGNDRLPEFSDWDDLPYISALLKELLRWACPLPFGIPKIVTEDNVYKGYHIPAGANIFENIWAVCYNETDFPEPHTYDPERFLKEGRLDTSIAALEESVFGSGRRICPGKHFALRTLFLNIACTLAVFDISASPGEKLEPKYHEGFARHPLPFKCVIKPRSAASLKLATEAGAMVDKGS